MNTDLSPLETNLPFKFESIQLQDAVNSSLLKGERKEGN